MSHKITCPPRIAAALGFGRWPPPGLHAVPAGANGECYGRCRFKKGSETTAAAGAGQPPCAATLQGRLPGNPGELSSNQGNCVTTQNPARPRLIAPSSRPLRNATEQPHGSPALVRAVSVSARGSPITCEPSFSSLIRPALPGAGPQAPSTRGHSCLVPPGSILRGCHARELTLGAGGPPPHHLLPPRSAPTIRPVPIPRRRPCSIGGGGPPLRSRANLRGLKRPEYALPEPATVFSEQSFAWSQPRRHFSSRSCCRCRTTRVSLAAFLAIPHQRGPEHHRPDDSCRGKPPSGLRFVFCQQLDD